MASSRRSVLGNWCVSSPQKFRGSLPKGGKIAKERWGKVYEGLGHDAARYERQLLADPRLVEAILSRIDMFPVVPRELDRVIRASRGNGERAVSTAMARVVAWGEFWRVEIQNV